MLRKLKEAARLYGHYLSINIRSAMQYKTSYYNVFMVNIPYSQ